MTTSSNRPSKTWLDDLPTNRLLAEMSLWSADLGAIAADTKRVEPYTDIYHVDVADGHFSPALLYFPDLLVAVRKATAKPLHVHIMVSDSVLLSQTEQFIEAGADLVSVHVENANAMGALALVRKAGLKSGVVLQLHTQVDEAQKFLPHIDMLTLLGTRIGVKGQGLDAESNDRLKQARALVKAYNKQRIIVAADGGIRDNTVPGLRAAGAQTIVMGSLAFGAPDLSQRMAWVHSQHEA